MRFSFLIILMFIGFGASAQVYQNMAQPGYKFGRARFDSVLTIPTGLGAMRNITGGQDTGQIRFNVSDSSVYVWNGRRWVRPVGGTDTTSLSNRINAKLNISDTAAMLSPYVRAASLTIPTLTQVLEAAPNSNEAGANQIKDLSAGTSQNDAATFGQLTDTANLRLRISDTSAMLRRYLDTLQAHNTRIISAGGGGSQWVTNGSNIYYGSGKVGVTTVSGAMTPISLLHLQDSVILTAADTTRGLILDNKQASILSGSTSRQSLPIVFRGTGWNNIAATSQVSEIRMYNSPITANPPNALLVVDRRTQGGAFSNLFTFSQLGGGTFGPVTVLNATGNEIMRLVTSGTNAGLAYGAGSNDGFAASNFHAFRGNMGPAGGSGEKNFFDLATTINITSSSTHSYTGIKLNVTETALGPSTLHHLMRLQTGGVNRFAVTNTGQVNIGNTTSVASAALQVTSTTQGVLIPRMTLTQRNAIASPAAGLQVIVTGETGGEFVSIYNSSLAAWVNATSKWSTNANGINYNGGNVGIGTATTTHGFEVHRPSASVINHSAFYSPTMTNNQRLLVQIGKSATANEAFYWNYNHNSTSSSRFISLQNNQFGPGTYSFAMTSDGNVGIGTVTPSQKLSILNTENNGSAGSIIDFTNNAALQGFVGTGSASFSNADYRSNMVLSSTNNLFLTSQVAGGAVRVRAGGIAAANQIAKFKSNGIMIEVGADNDPTARLHIGTASNGSAGTAPLKLTAGTNLTTAEAGAVEFDGTNYWVTTTGAGRVLLVRTITGTAAPATTPAAVGMQFVDTTNKKLYVATGTASSADWTILN